jgi:hypothetical protein
MDIKELESLGITKEQIIERVIEACADRIMTDCGLTDEDGNPRSCQENSPLAIKLKAIVKERIDAGLAQVVDKHILPNVTQYIENVTLQETNKWGEKRGSLVTFIEYLTGRAEAYLTEKVDYQGKSQGESQGYSWIGSQTRITHMVHEDLHYSIATAMKKALEIANSAIATGIEETVRIKLQEVCKSLQVKVKLP